MNVDRFVLGAPVWRWLLWGGLTIFCLALLGISIPTPEPDEQQGGLFQGQPIEVDEVFEQELVFHSGPIPLKGTSLGVVIAKRLRDNSLFGIWVGLPYDPPPVGTPVQVRSIRYHDWEKDSVGRSTYRVFRTLDLGTGDGP